MQIFLLSHLAAVLLSNLLSSHPPPSGQPLSKFIPLSFKDTVQTTSSAKTFPCQAEKFQMCPPFKAGNKRLAGGRPDFRLEPEPFPLLDGALQGSAQGAAHRGFSVNTNLLRY